MTLCQRLVRWHGRQYHPVGALAVDDLVVLLERDYPHGVLLWDVEPLLVPWDHPCPAEALAAACARLPTVLARRSVVVTNSRRFLPARLSIPLVAGARKPWTRSSLEDFAGAVVVIGDTVLTDGLLAFRLGIDFLHVAEPSSPRPLIARVEVVLGTVLLQHLRRRNYE